MPVELFVNKDLGVIDVRSYGIVTRKDLFSALELSNALRVKSNINKVVVDTSEEKELPTVLDLDDFGSSIPRSVKTAIIITDEQPMAMRSRFFVNIASVKGANIDMFSTREDALKWLNS
jgi:hypothetical protein